MLDIPVSELIVPPFSRRAFVLGALGAAYNPAAAKAADSSIQYDVGLSFLVVGDWGRDGKTYQRHVAAFMAATANQTNSKFIISTGDNFYNLGISGENDRQWQTSFENIYQATSLQVPWHPVLGNHDYGGNVVAQLMRSKNNPRWRMESKFRVLSPSPLVDIFLIDTVLWIGKESFPYKWLGSPIDPNEAALQRDWLEAELGISKARFKLVIGHHPIYSVGPHGGRPAKPQMRELDDLLRAHGVTAYICGHDHCLYSIEHAGMHYICSGGGSAELPRFTGDPSSFGCVLPGLCSAGLPRWTTYVDRAGFASFHVTPNDLEFQFVDRSGLVTRPRSLLEPAVSLQPAQA